MVTLSNKVFAILLIGVAAIIAFIVCAAANVGGLGKALSGFGGPITAGLFGAGKILPNFAMSSGYAMLIVYISALLIFPLIVAYVVWHYDIGYKLQGLKGNAGAGNYQATPSQNIIPISGMQSTPTAAPTEEKK